MISLYINIAGADIPNTEKQVVVGRPEHAIINKFYFELAKEIVKGVNTPGIGDAKNKRLIIDFEAGHESDFEEITNQWDCVKQALLGENPTGNHTIKLPSEYIKWLAYNSNRVYNEIAKSLSSRGGTVEISIDKIYANAIGLLVNNIDTTEHYDQFVVNDKPVDDDSQISKDIRKKIGAAVPFVPFDEYVNNIPLDAEDETKNNGEEYKDSTAPNGNSPTFNGLKKYDTIESFHEGLAVVCRNGKYGFINLDGEEIIECKYEVTRKFGDGIAPVQLDDKFFFIGKNGSIAFPIPGRSFTTDGFNEGLCDISVWDEDDEVWKFGYINRNGEVVIDFSQIDGGKFACGFALVSADGWNSLYYIDKKGNAVFGETYNYASDFFEGFAIVTDFDKRSYVINIKGERVFEFPKRSFWNHVDSEMILYGIEDKHSGLLKVIWFHHCNQQKRHSYSSIINVYGGYFSEGLMSVQTDNKKWGFVNDEGILTIPCFFDEAHDFNEGLAAVSKDGLWGYIDKKNDLIIPYQYSAASDFCEGRAVVRKDDIPIVIDKKDNRIV